MKTVGEEPEGEEGEVRERANFSSEVERSSSAELEPEEEEEELEVEAEDEKARAVVRLLEEPARRPVVSKERLCALMVRSNGRIVMVKVVLQNGNGCMKNVKR